MEQLSDENMRLYNLLLVVFFHILYNIDQPFKVLLTGGDPDKVQLKKIVQVSTNQYKIRVFVQSNIQSISNIFIQSNMQCQETNQNHSDLTSARLNAARIT